MPQRAATEMDFIIACIECSSCHYVESGVHKVECSSEARDGVVFIIIMEDANPRPRARSACTTACSLMMCFLIFRLGHSGRSSSVRTAPMREPWYSNAQNVAVLGLDLYWCHAGTTRAGWTDPKDRYKHLIANTSYRPSWTLSTVEITS